MIGAAVWQGWAWAVQWGRGAAWDGWNLKSIFSAGKQGESGEVIVYQAQAEGQKALEEEQRGSAPPLPSLTQDMQPPSKWGGGAAPGRQTASP